MTPQLAAANERKAGNIRNRREVARCAAAELAYREAEKRERLRLSDAAIDLALANIDARFHTFDKGRSLSAGTLEIANIPPVYEVVDTGRPAYSMGRDPARVHAVRGGEANKRNHLAKGKFMAEGNI